MKHKGKKMMMEKIGAFIQKKQISTIAEVAFAELSVIFMYKVFNESQRSFHLPND